MNRDDDELPEKFVDDYYKTFDANPVDLGNLYKEGSMLTYEGQKIQGKKNILTKLTSHHFQKCQHSIATIDRQAFSPTGGVLFVVTGHLQLASEQHALKFSQMFQLMPTPQGSFYILNDIFRLNYA